MRDQPDDQEIALRKRWLAVLSRAETSALEAAWTDCGVAHSYRFLRRPEIGLIMIRGRAGGTGQPFNLGEMTVTRCAVQVDGTAAVGFGYVSGRRKRHAELVAAFDSLLQSGERRAVILQRVIDPLAKAQRDSRRALARKVADTKVEFFTMARGG